MTDIKNNNTRNQLKIADTSKESNIYPLLISMEYHRYQHNYLISNENNIDPLLISKENDRYPNIRVSMKKCSYLIQYLTQGSGYMQDISIQNLTDARYHF